MLDLKVLLENVPQTGPLAVEILRVTARQEMLTVPEYFLRVSQVLGTARIEKLLCHLYTNVEFYDFSEGKASEIDRQNLAIRFRHQKAAEFLLSELDSGEDSHWEKILNALSESEQSIRGLDPRIASRMVAATLCVSRALQDRLECIGRWKFEPLAVSQLHDYFFDGYHLKSEPLECYCKPLQSANKRL